MKCAWNAGTSRSYSFGLYTVTHTGIPHFGQWWRTPPYLVGSRSKFFCHMQEPGGNLPTRRVFSTSCRRTGRRAQAAAEASNSRGIHERRVRRTEFTARRRGAGPFVTIRLLRQLRMAAVRATNHEVRAVVRATNHEAALGPADRTCSACNFIHTITITATPRARR